ncbi:hypothetical protein GA0115255_120396 [Streptomyces sp. Ncost-T6T-2b]|nr:hypothetical protein GA0115255_120396 [Streptomyces sp. Ncost-T6T-2b]
MGGTVDELDPEVPLQGGEGAGHGGLGQPEAGGGACDVELVGDREEGPQMPEFHGAAGGGFLVHAREA